MISSVAPGRHPGFVTTRVRARPVAAFTCSAGGKARLPAAARPREPSVQARVAAGNSAATIDTGPEALPIKQPTSHGSPTKASERRSQMYPVAEAAPVRVRVRPEAANINSPSTPQPPCTPGSPHTPSLMRVRQSRASAVLRASLASEAREEAREQEVREEEAREEVREEEAREEVREDAREVMEDAIPEFSAAAPTPTRQRVPFPSLASELPAVWSKRPYHDRTRAAAILFDKRLERSSNGARRALVMLEKTGGSALHASQQLER